MHFFSSMKIFKMFTIIILVFIFFILIVTFNFHRLICLTLSFFWFFYFLSTVLMLFTLIWIINFFQAFLSFIIGGCVLWEFIKEHSSPEHSLPFDMSSGPVQPAPDRVVLHLYCALHSSLGSICKGTSYHLSRLEIILFNLFIWRTYFYSSNSISFHFIPSILF